MNTTRAMRILLCTEDRVSGELAAILGGNGYEIQQQSLAAPPDKLDPFSLILIDGSGPGERALALCHHLRGRLAELFVPIVLIIDDTRAEARLAALESGADVYLLRPFAPAELLAQVQAFVRFKEHHNNLSDKAAEVNRVNKRLQAAYQQIDQELALARRIQESFLPQSLPQVPHIKFAVHYQPCGHVGGDFYDIFRLDEQHLGFYVADAMGHGVPASLLTIFVKKGVRTKEINGSQYRLIPPGEVLKRLNRDMIDQALSENPFITMVYVLLNFQERVLSFARSGHPYPLYLPRSGPPVLWEIQGSLLGVFDTEYPVQRQKLLEGDKVLLYTDGIDAAGFEDYPLGQASLLAAVQRFRDLPIRDLVPRLAGELFTRTRLADDLTLVGLEATG